ncbi:hypothetical protein D3C81_1310250 [compost metagenome]
MGTNAYRMLVLKALLLLCRCALHKPYKPVQAQELLDNLESGITEYEKNESRGTKI